MRDSTSTTIETVAEADERLPGQHVVGSLLLFGGAGVFCLALIESISGLPFAMPRFWHVNLHLWYFFSIAAFVFGCYLLRDWRPASENWQPGVPGRRFDSVVLYTRAGCHLCDHAKDMLLKYRHCIPEPQEVDIESDDQLREKFCTCIPVVEIDGRVRFRGQVNEMLLRRLIEGTAPRGTG
jgi:hypothetical protein